MVKTESSPELERRKKIEDEINRIIISLICANQKTEKGQKNKWQEKDKKEKDKTSRTLDRLLENSRKNILSFKELLPAESRYFFAHKTDAREETIRLKYGLKDEDISYSVDASYLNSDSGQKTKISVSARDEINNTIAKYSISIKEDREDGHYLVLVKYEGMDEAASISYRIPIIGYHEAREEKLQDFTNAADKSLEILPPSVMGSVLGFTYLGENYMARRSDLAGSRAFMVDLHEAIHTPDEYETRVLVDWMLMRGMPRYKR